jgi:heptosyltransferase-2
MKIVVRTPNWIGDCVMCLPALRVLREAYPSSPIHLAARSYVEDIFTSLEGIAGIIRLPAGGAIPSLVRGAGRLRPYHFDLGVLFTNSFHSALMFRLAGVRRLAGYRRDGRGFLLDHKPDFPEGDEHHVQFYSELVAGLPAPERESDRTALKISGLLRIAENERGMAAEILSGEGVDPSLPMIGLSPFAAHGPAKEWPGERFAALARGIQRLSPDIQVLIFASEGEREKGAAIAGAAPGTVNLAGRLTLRQSMAAMSLCSLFISNDSGLMHVAAALALPTIALFGPTQPHKTSPLHSEIRLFHKPVECAPCNHRECPTDHGCMRGIEVDEVLEAADEMLRDAGRRRHG